VPVVPEDDPVVAGRVRALLVQEARGGAVSIKHVISRAWERYGIIVTLDDVCLIARMIERRHPGARYVCEDKVAGVTRWRVEFKGKNLRVVWCEKDRFIITLLPLSDTASGTWRIGNIAKKSKIK
jgi:hypothetical protein